MVQSKSSKLIKPFKTKNLHRCRVDRQELLDTLNLSRSQLIAASIISGQDYIRGVDGYAMTKALGALEGFNSENDKVGFYLRTADIPVEKQSQLEDSWRQGFDLLELMEAYNAPMNLRKIMPLLKKFPQDSILDRFLNEQKRDGTLRRAGLKEKVENGHAQASSGTSDLSPKARRAKQRKFREEFAKSRAQKTKKLVIPLTKTLTESFMVDTFRYFEDQQFKNIPMDDLAALAKAFDNSIQDDIEMDIPSDAVVDAQSDVLDHAIQDDIEVDISSDSVSSHVGAQSSSEKDQCDVLDNSIQDDIEMDIPSDAVVDAQSSSEMDHSSALDNVIQTGLQMNPSPQVDAAVSEEMAEEQPAPKQKRTVSDGRREILSHYKNFTKCTRDFGLYENMLPYSLKISGFLKFMMDMVGESRASSSSFSY